MKQIKLKTYPKTLPDDAEVRDFDLGGGKYARVIMQVKREVHNGVDHFVLYGQAYEMDKNGNFKAAPLGYPSRSASTSSSVIASAIGRTIEMDDAWVEVAINHQPGGDLADGVKDINTGKPTKPGSEYGETVYSKKDQKAYRWTEGFADIFARTKVEDLLVVLKTSDVHSGFAFRKNRTTK